MNLYQRTREKIEKEETIDEICAHVANGGALTGLCDVWQVRYSDIVVWIYQDKSRSIPYENALRANGEWMVNKLLDELRKIATVDIRRAYDEHGALKPIAEIPAEVAGCIQAIETEELFHGKGEDREQIGYVKRVKFWDKLKSIELLGKKLALFIDRVEHSGRMTLEDLVSKSMNVVMVKQVSVSVSAETPQLTSSETEDDVTVRSDNKSLPE